jgi:hypothetical protein
VFGLFARLLERETSDFAGHTERVIARARSPISVVAPRRRPDVPGVAHDDAGYETRMTSS